MQSKADKMFDNLVEKYLGKRLPGGMAASISMSKLPSESREFMMRMLSLMKRAQYSATGFNPLLIRWLSVTVPSILPGAWGGRIPPLTLPDRHKKLDDYVASQKSAAGSDPCVFLDMGCGFPPVTTVDTARKLTGWHIYGVDRVFADYVLYDKDGHYACFDRKGSFLYFQAFMNISGRALYADPEAARNRFNRLFERLYPLLQHSNAKRSETAQKDGNRLIYNHIRDFETDKLTFIQSDLMDLRPPPVEVARCMNVLTYFTPEVRKEMLVQAGKLLKYHGMLIAGTNGLGIQTRYAVYRKGTDGLFLDEFAFGLDNLGHIVFMPFFTIHENDPEAWFLAELVGVIRANPSFWVDFSKRQDELLKQYSICQRRSDGFLYFPNDDMPIGEYMEKNAHLWHQMTKEGYLDGAVDVLGQAGYDAWKNPVGDIAVGSEVENMEV